MRNSLFYMIVLIVSLTAAHWGAYLSPYALEDPAQRMQQAQTFYLAAIVATFALAFFHAIAGAVSDRREDRRVAENKRERRRRYYANRSAKRKKLKLQGS